MAKVTTKSERARVRSNMRNRIDVSAKKWGYERDVMAKELRHQRSMGKDLRVGKGKTAPARMKARANGAYAGTLKQAYAKNRSSARWGLTDPNQGVGAHAKARAQIAANIKKARASKQAAKKAAQPKPPKSTLTPRQKRSRTQRKAKATTKERRSMAEQYKALRSRGFKFTKSKGSNQWAGTKTVGKKGGILRATVGLPGAKQKPDGTYTRGGRSAHTTVRRLGKLGGGMGWENRGARTMSVRPKGQRTEAQRRASIANLKKSRASRTRKGK